MDLSLRDAATLLNVSESTLSRWINAEGLPAFMINGRYRLNRVDLLEWANHRKIPAAGLYARPKGAEALSLAALLEGNIHRDVPGGDLASTMTSVAERLPLASAKDKALAAQAMADRESKGSTVVAEGIAIPHVRSPLIFGVEHPAVALCFMKEAVDFGAGHAPVRVIWALVSPTIRLHLALLAKIASALNDEALRGLLSKRAPDAELLARLRSLE